MDNWGYLSLIRRWWWTLLVATWVAGLLAFVVAIQIPPTFESRARLLVGPINTDLNTLRAGGQLVQTYAELVTSRPLLESTVEELGLDIDASDLEESVSASPDDVRRLLTIRVQSSDRDEAAAIANTLAQELIQLASGGAGPARPEGELSIIEFAEASGAPVAPQVSLLVILAAIAGLLGALVLILLVEFFSDRIRSQEELAELARSPVLASVALPEGATGKQPTLLFEPPPGSVDFSLLATKIRATDDGAVRRLLVVGLRDGDDAGAVAANLAAALAANGATTALIDAEGADRGITARLRLDDRPGLSRLIENPATALARLDLPSVRGVTIVPAGEEPTPVDTPAAAAAILDRLGASHDVLVVHGAPAATSAAALSWASAVDAVLLVVPADGGSRGPVTATAENLSVIGARLLGVVRLADRPARRIAGRRTIGGADASARPAGVSQASPAAGGDPIGEGTTARRSREPAARRR